MAREATAESRMVFMDRFFLRKREFFGASPAPPLSRGNGARPPDRHCKERRCQSLAKSEGGIYTHDPADFALTGQSLCRQGVVR